MKQFCEESSFVFLLQVLVDYFHVKCRISQLSVLSTQVAVKFPCMAKCWIVGSLIWNRVQHCNMSSWGVDGCSSDLIEVAQSWRHRGVHLFFANLFAKFENISHIHAYSILDTLAEFCGKGFAPAQPLGLRRWDDVGCERIWGLAKTSETGIAYSSSMSPPHLKELH